MEPQVGNTAVNILNSETTKIVAKRLWPSMLFLIVMSIISMFAIWFFNDADSMSRQVGFWIWFGIQMLITCIGAYVFMMDARILTSSERIASVSGE